ncbi:unnamed protein product [Rotaria magnacalcarata]|uniref:Uncharacterized protein n=4 Tax=Rotaria magnacalcarata TaxID=392030 RepID=A0A816Z4I6_9BILA|nr:unnamed protein product [Rotaria magnacalcarata]CAF1682851.1 unnamed protein product [Rotaria magnacalcarata]CAF2041132.1 unnamed protein product [Rotaria magnacalcarata]CAF2058021.1 unnamed protein product [Rotaria magnacalcarata]CAF2176333.1 unnamed protein product [Rotaria magnacalcarata]
MNFNISIQLVLHLILCDWTYYVYSASSSSAFASSVKLINRKGDSGMNSRKHKVSATNAIDIDDDITLQFNSDESRLRATLLESYVPEARPVTNTTTVTVVDVGLNIIQVMNLDEQNQVMTTNVQVTLKWQDEHLRWLPNEYNDQNRTVFSALEIWTPDIVLFNSADVAYSQRREYYLLTVHWNGTVEWVYPDVFRSYCDVVITYFPFDKQNCTLEIQSWSRPSDELLVRHQPQNVRQQSQYIRTEWQVYEIVVQNATMNRYLWLVFQIKMKRNYQFYVNHMIFPFSILSCLTLFVFWLPPDSGEKITLTITILLALTVFLQLISDYTPKASSNLPIIGIYFNVNLILVLISVVLTVVVLNFHYRGPKKSRVPRWCRRIVMGKIGCWLGFHFISDEQLLSQSNSTKTNVRRSTRRDTSNGEIRRGEKNTKTKLPLLPITTAAKKTTTNSSKTTANNDDDDNGTEETTQKSTQQHSLTHNIEQILLTMQTQFDPNSIDDEELKLSILREILECQRLLLTIHARRQNVQSQLLYDIYEEWKILAIIVDRICFIFYLISMLAASVIFFVREPILKRNG